MVPFAVLCEKILHILCGKKLTVNNTQSLSQSKWECNQ